MKTKRWAHLFNIYSNYYIYDAGRNTILKIDKDAFELLKQEKDENEQTDNVIEEIENDGFLCPSNIQEIEHPFTEMLPFYLNRKLKSIVLQVTQNCNLRCKYCIYSGGYNNRLHNCKDMSPDIAMRGIDYLVDHSIDQSEINLGFYGGEPLLKFDLIQDCIQYIENIADGKKITFNLTTNGTLLTKRIIEYFISKNVRIVISLDGPQSIQNTNRVFINGSGTFEAVYKNLSMIQQCYPDYYKSNLSFNTVLDPKNSFNCINQYFSSDPLFRESSFNSSIISTRYKKESLDYSENFETELNYEIFKLYLSKMGKISAGDASKLLKGQYENINRKLGGKQNSIIDNTNTKAHRSGPCIPGKRLFLNCEGTFFPCERVSESSDSMKIGSVYSGIDVQKCSKLLNIGKISEERCKKCWAFWFCNLCAGDADDLQGLSENVLQQQCVEVKKGVDNMLKDYCALRENGHDFQFSMCYKDYSEQEA